MVARLPRLIALACAGALLAQSAGNAQQEADLNRAKNAVVMIRSTLPAGTANGAGIVVAVSGQDVYIATAAHILHYGGTATAATVQFNQRQGQWVNAQILDLRDQNLDVAMLMVRLPASMNPSMLVGPGAVASAPLARGADVFPLGYPEQNAWDIPVTADKVARTDTLRLVFQSQYVRPGSSGGALLDPCGRIVGMVTEVTPPNATAIRIEPVLEAVARWSLPSRMTVAPASPCGAAAAVTPAITPPPATRVSTADIRRMHDRDEWAESLPLLDRLIADQPASAEALALRSHAYSHLDRPADALLDGERAVKVGPNLAESYLRRGEAYSANGKTTEALADYARTLKISPREFEAFVNQGFAYNSNRDPKRAIEAANRALDIRTDRFEPWAVRASSYLQLENYDDALFNWSEAIKRRPNHAGLLVGRASAYAGQKQFELALNDAHQALRIQADNPEALITRAGIYFMLNRDDAAREDLNYALKLRPGMSDASELLRAIDARAAAAPSRPSSSNAFTPPPVTPAGGNAVGYARLLDQTTAALQGGRMAEAGALIDQMITTDPARNEGWGLRGAMLVGANNLPAAYEAYMASLTRNGTAFFRVVHDHGGVAGCVGGLAISRQGVTFQGENGGHQLSFPIASISEAALNPFFGVNVGMFHLRALAGRNNEVFNFSVVRITDTQIVNRRPEAELLVGLINQMRQPQGFGR